MDKDLGIFNLGLGLFDLEANERKGNKYVRVLGARVLNELHQMLSEMVTAAREMTTATATRWRGEG